MEFISGGLGNEVTPDGNKPLPWSAYVYSMLTDAAAFATSEHAAAPAGRQPGSANQGIFDTKSDLLAAGVIAYEVSDDTTRLHMSLATPHNLPPQLFAGKDFKESNKTYRTPDKRDTNCLLELDSAVKDDIVALAEDLLNGNVENAKAALHRVEKITSDIIKQSLG
jgi:hypothetical protein